ncbi:MAG TPA: FtsX-like permease family protein [Rhizomicrobium sp.]|nr:FtsX-like permease family protein [Rhizomicrobium sp.]
MLRHFLITTWRSLQANRLQSVIAIFGLSLGLAAAILAGLVIANQLSLDDFIPGHDNLYFAAIKNPFGGHGGFTEPEYTLESPHDLAAVLKQDIPQVRDVTRFQRDHLRLRHGDMEAREFVYWVDPNIFRLLRLPVLYGDLDTALARPDGIVLPVSTARKYFGRDDVVGQIIEINRIHAMTVMAVVADLPQNSSNFATAIFASGKAAFSELAKDDLNPPMGTDGKIWLDGTTLVQLAPGASVSDAQARITGLIQPRIHFKSGLLIDVHLLRLDRAHVSHDLAPALGARLGIFSLVAVLVLFLGCANFVNISTARAARRGVEVGIRKASGASRTMLMVQFLGEGVVQALLALCIATMIVELSLPSVNAFLQTGAVFDYWRDPVLALSLLAGAAAVGVLAGAYPALILSAFQPAVVLKGLMLGVSRTVLVRQLLVGLQFAILIVLIAASVIVFEQYRFSIREALRVNTDQMMFIRDQRCESPFEAGVRALPGVRGEACSSLAMLPELGWAEGVKRHDGGKPFPLRLIPAGYGLFELYGLSPRAGRFFSRDHGGDEVPANPAPDLMAHYVINETAVRQLGFASPQAAIGQRISFDQPPPSHNAPSDKSGGPAALNGTSYSDGPATRETLDGIIIGVVPDFSLFPIEDPVSPIAYSVGWTVLKPEPKATLIHVRLRGHDIPETLDAIDRLWRKTVADRPIDRTFLDSYIEDLVIGMLRQGQMFGIFAGIAVLLSCLGLFALTSAAAERRTKEIGIRKAMGASSIDIVLLLLWQFLKPVLWAVVIAVPLAWVLMQRWLSGYAYHVMPGPWPYLAAAVLAVAIALATVITHAILTARAVPATALRYE